MTPVRPLDIGGRRVGPGRPCFVIAEVGLAHDGSLGMAHAYIDAVAAAEVDAVKFQCHIAEAESTRDEPWRVMPTWPQDASRYEYWRRTAFTAEQWWSLRAHADDAGVAFLCSPFSIEAVRLLDQMVAAWKVPSGEITNEALLAAVSATEKPVLLSTGMATRVEIHRAWSMVPREVALLQCTSLYPCPPEKLGLAVMADLRQSYNCPVGLSDHSGTVWAGVAAAALGAELLEVHVTLSRRAFGFDVESSVTAEELGQLVRGVRFAEAARGSGDKDQLAEELRLTRELFMGKHKRRAALA